MHNSKKYTVVVDWFEMCISGEIPNFDKDAELINLTEKIFLKKRDFSTPCFQYVYDLYFDDLDFAVLEAIPRDHMISSGIYKHGYMQLQVKNHCLYGVWVEILELIMKMCKWQVNNLTRVDISLDGADNLLVFLNRYEKDDEIRKKGKTNIRGDFCDNKIKYYKTFYLGSQKSNKHGKVYNKTVEIEQYSNKRYIQDFWIENGLESFVNGKYAISDMALYKLEKMNVPVDVLKALSFYKDLSFDSEDDLMSFLCENGFDKFPTNGIGIYGKLKDDFEIFQKPKKTFCFGDIWKEIEYYCRKDVIRFEISIKTTLAHHVDWHQLNKPVYLASLLRSFSQKWFDFYVMDFSDKNVTRMSKKNELEPIDWDSVEGELLEFEKLQPAKKHRLAKMLIKGLYMFNHADGIEVKELQDNMNIITDSFGLATWRQYREHKWHAEAQKIAKQKAIKRAQRIAAKPKFVVSKQAKENVQFNTLERERSKQELSEFYEQIENNV